MTDSPESHRPRPPRATWARTLSRFGVAHPRRTILLAALLTLAISPGVLRLELRTDGHAMVPPAAPEVRVDAQIRREFGINDLFVILIRSRHPDGIYNVETLELVRTLTAEIATLPGLTPAEVMSLATEKGDRFQERALDFHVFLEPFPDSAEALDRLRDDLETLALHVGTLVSNDGSATAIHVGVPPGADRLTLYESIVTACERQEREASFNSIDVIGAPVAETLLGSHILDDLGVPNRLLGRTIARRAAPESGEPTAPIYKLRRVIGGTVGLVPLALVLMMLVFLAAFRRPVLMFIPLIEVGVCLVFVFALMGWTGVPVYLTIAVLPIILTSIGVADEIHILSRYIRRLPATGPADRGRPAGAAGHAGAIDATMDELAGPVVRTSLTTAAAFGAFALSPIDAVQAFGVFAAVGILVCMTWSLLVTPALLVLVPPSWIRSRRESGDSAAARRLGRLAVGAARHRGPVLAAALVLIAAASFGASRVVIQDSWVGGFDPASDFSRSRRWFDEHFFGTHVLLVCVDTGSGVFRGEVPSAALGQFEVTLPANAVPEPALIVGCPILISRRETQAIEPRPEGVPAPPHRFLSWVESVAVNGEHLVVTVPRRTGSPAFGLQPREGETFAFEIALERLTVPEVLHRIEGLETYIEGRTDCAVGGVLGPVDFLATTNFIIKKREAGSRTIPSSPRAVMNLWRQYERIRGAARARQLIGEEYSRALLQVFLAEANYADTQRLMNGIRAYAERELEPAGIHLSFAGDVAVSQTLIAAIVSTQVRSLLISLVVIVLLTALLCRSWRSGLLCSVPCVFAVVLNFGFMGAVSMPLGVATSMFAGMILGIGVDYAIHLLARFDDARGAGFDVETAIDRAATEVGPAILIDGIAVAIGFGVLCLSQVPANARLGQLAILCIASCLAATLILLPALLRRSSPRSGA